MSDTSDRLLGETTNERRASCQVAPGLTFTKIESTLQDGQTRYVRVLSVDFAAFTGKIRATTGKTVKDRERTSDMAGLMASQGLEPLAAVNGGFFDIASEFSPGALGGLTVADGKILNSAANGEAALTLGNHGTNLWIDKVWSQSRITFTPPGGSPSRPDHVVDGLNREPGRIQGCGGGMGPAGENDRNSHPDNLIDARMPQLGIHCLDSDETIVFTEDFGALPFLPGTVRAVLVGADRTVKQVSDTTSGLVAGPGEHVVVATGSHAAWLQTDAVVGSQMSLPAADVRRGASAETAVYFNGTDDAVVNGGPWLVKNGAEGPFDFNSGTTPEHAYLTPMNSRTAAGITTDRKLLLVVVDKKSGPAGPAHGLTMPQLAQAMKNLGATEAVNLDGGGSSTMWVKGALANHPSDGTGEERYVGNAIVVTAK
ncbi:phosphodiester glycosidase family protein [Streptomyces parvus]|uniref:Phosphodiester glycosidase family protein n=1 Tax=Streptomyces parvus TaxID=66428 RepID=A0A7K3S1V9_9ACTN|nr:phosphodiester glycosidase family protein [Streptomyces parvus]